MSVASEHATKSGAKPPAGQSIPKLALVKDIRFRWFSVAFVLFVLATIGAVLQPPRPNPYETSAVGSKDWWLYPREENPELRLPHVCGEFIDVIAAPAARSYGRSD